MAVASESYKEVEKRLFVSPPKSGEKPVSDVLAF
jgi:hypothetical protein